MQAINHVGILKCIIGLQMALLISITGSKPTREIVFASLPHCSTRMIFDSFPYCTAFLRSVCLLERPKENLLALKKSLCKAAKLFWALPPAVPGLLALFQLVQVSVHMEWNELFCGLGEFIRTPTICFSQMWSIIWAFIHEDSFEGGEFKQELKYTYDIYIYTYIFIYK